MNSVLLQAVTVVNPGSPFHGQQADILLKNGIIEAIAAALPVLGDEFIVDGTGQVVAPGFFDLNATFGDPGLESREDLESGLEAAVAGGFTAVGLMPDTQPPVHSKSEVAYLKNKARGLLADVYPFGTISHKREGKDLAELYDMSLSGAVAFTDGDRPVSDAGLMSRAMQYVKGFGGIVFSFAEDRSLAGSGKINEGAISTYLGIKGIPALAEEIMVLRDIYLAEYNDSSIHFSTISTAHSVELVRSAKKRGLRVTCDVAAHHLWLTEELLEGFDSNYKVKPPLRTPADREALLAGLRDGTIDAIVSQHRPHEIEFKDIEFESAAYGISTLQTVLPMCLAAGLSNEELVEKLAVGPRNILCLAVPRVAEGEPANLVVFDPAAKWTFDVRTNRSKSANSPFFGQELTGKVTFVYNNHQYKDFR